MRNGFLAATAGLALTVAVTAGAAEQATGQAPQQAADLDISHCSYPEPPAVPDGATATEAEMGQAGADVRQFVAHIESSLQCLMGVEESLGDDITEEQQATLVAIYNSGVDQMNDVVEQYNTQVRAFQDQQ